MAFRHNIFEIPARQERVGMQVCLSRAAATSGYCLCARADPRGGDAECGVRIAADAYDLVFP